MTLNTLMDLNSVTSKIIHYRNIHPFKLPRLAGSALNSQLLAAHNKPAAADGRNILIEQSKKSLTISDQYGQ